MTSRIFAALLVVAKVVGAMRPSRCSSQLIVDSRLSEISCSTIAGFLGAIDADVKSDATHHRACTALYTTAYMPEEAERAVDTDHFED